MRKSKLYLATAMLVLSVTGCSSSVDENPTTTVIESDTSIETTIDEAETTSIEEITTSSDETESETETKTKEETTEVETEETAEAETNEETSEEETTEAEESAEVSEGETEKDTETVKETEKETTVKETTVKETTVKETTGKPSQTEPTKPIETKPVETKPTETKPVKETTEAPIVIVKPVSITVKINGSHYVGDTLSASDFEVTVTMSDGKKITNPSGWAASTLKLTGTSTSVTVSYNGVSTTVNVAATEKPTQPTQPQQQPNNGATYAGTSIADAAFNCLGLPYVAGGTTRSGFDCSGFVAYCYAQAGISIPTGTVGQKTCGTKLEMWDAYIGDIVVTEADGWIHTGIYAGEGMVYEARDGQGVALNPVALGEAIDNSKTGRKIYAIRPGNNTSKSNEFIIKDDALYNEVLDQWNEAHNLRFIIYTGEILTINGRTSDLSGRKYDGWYFLGPFERYFFRDKSRETTLANSYMFTNIW